MTDLSLPMEGHVGDVDWSHESEDVDEGSLEWRQVACHPCEVLDVLDDEVENENNERNEPLLEVGCQ